MIERNPAPNLNTHASYYLKHFMNLLTEAGNGGIPLSKIYGYADRWRIDDWEHFSDVILRSYETFRSEMNEVAKQENKK